MIEKKDIDRLYDIIEKILSPTVLSVEGYEIVREGYETVRDNDELHTLEIIERWESNGRELSQIDMLFGVDDGGGSLYIDMFGPAYHYKQELKFVVELIKPLLKTKGLKYQEVMISGLAGDGLGISLDGYFKDNWLDDLEVLEKNLPVILRTLELYKL